MYVYRHRVRDTRRKSGIVSGYYGGQSGGNPPIVTPETIGSPILLGRRRDMYDIPTPSYYSRIRENRDVSNPASWSDVTRTSTDGSWSFNQYRTNPAPGFRGFGAYSGDHSSFLPLTSISLPSYISSDEATARSYLLTSALADANSSEFQGQTFAAEALKTLSMLRSPFKGIQSLLGKMSKHREGLVRTGVHISEASASAWLEYRYGWRPLLMDCSDLFEALYSTKRVPLTTLRSSHRQDLSWSGSDTRIVFNNGTIRHTGTHKLSYKATARAGVRYRIKDSSYEQWLGTKLGLSLDFVPSTVWELVPFSFVADWFVNVGDWIRSVVPNPHIEVVSNFTSIRRSVESEMTWPKVEFNATSYDIGSWVHAGSAGSFTELTLSGDRQVNVAVPTVPVLVPGRLSLLRKLDGFSLLFQSLTGQLKSFRHF